MNPPESAEARGDILANHGLKVNMLHVTLIQFEGNKNLS